MISTPASTSTSRKNEEEDKYRYRSGHRCPVCDKYGSPQLKSIRNRKGGNGYRYVYYAHPTGPHTVSWCYVGGKSLPQKKLKRVRGGRRGVKHGKSSIP